ncbi:MAG TPA: SgcJ/EcaC family oxidoreductase [Steroidobacteraceae bacterium]|nr:SgcJ/EcaC family oxidoreductase [Steroidobacteraceae bacterium]
MLNAARHFFTVAIAVIAIAGVNVAAAQTQETVAAEYAPLPEFRVFSQPAAASDEAAIAELMRRYGAAWGSADVEGAVAAYTEDAEWTNAFADVYRGHEALRQQFTQLFKRFESGSMQGARQGDKEVPRPEMKRGRVSLRYLGDDAAVVHSYTESDWGVNREGGGLRRVHVTFVLEKQQDDQWLIAHQMIMDARR